MKKIFLRSFLYLGLCFISLTIAQTLTGFAEAKYMQAIIENKLYDYQFIWNCDLPTEDLRILLYDIANESSNVFVAKLLIFIFIFISCYWALNVQEHFQYFKRLIEQVASLVRELLNAHKL